MEGYTFDSFKDQHTCAIDSRNKYLHIEIYGPHKSWRLTVLQSSSKQPHNRIAFRRSRTIGNNLTYRHVVKGVGLNGVSNEIYAR